VILDVRTPAEFSQGYIENAKNIDFYANTFRNQLDKLDKQKTYLVYCRSGNRSGKTLRMMEQSGFEKVYNLTGGIGQWSRQRLPLVR
jgi:rhodanese-related sulfurtransferase